HFKSEARARAPNCTRSSPKHPVYSIIRTGFPAGPRVRFRPEPSPRPTLTPLDYSPEVDHPPTIDHPPENEYYPSSRLAIGDRSIGLTPPSILIPTHRKCNLEPTTSLPSPFLKKITLEKELPIITDSESEEEKEPTYRSSSPVLEKIVRKKTLSILSDSEDEIDKAKQARRTDEVPQTMEGNDQTPKILGDYPQTPFVERKSDLQRDGERNRERERRRDSRGGNHQDPHQETRQDPRLVLKGDSGRRHEENLGSSSTEPTHPPETHPEQGDRELRQRMEPLDREKEGLPGASQKQKEAEIQQTASTSSKREQPSGPKSLKQPQPSSLEQQSKPSPLGRTREPRPLEQQPKTGSFKQSVQQQATPRGKRRPRGCSEMGESTSSYCSTRSVLSPHQKVNPSQSFQSKALSSLSTINHNLTTLEANHDVNTSKLLRVVEKCYVKSTKTLSEISDQLSDPLPVQMGPLEKSLVYHLKKEIDKKPTPDNSADIMEKLEQSEASILSNVKQDLITEVRVYVQKEVETLTTTVTTSFEGIMSQLRNMEQNSNDKFNDLQLVETENKNSPSRDLPPHQTQNVKEDDDRGPRLTEKEVGKLLPPLSEWVSFSGEGEYDYIEFIQYCDLILETYWAKEDIVVVRLPRLFRGVAKVWWKTKSAAMGKASWQTWKDLMKAQFNTSTWRSKMKEAFRKEKLDPSVHVISTWCVAQHRRLECISPGLSLKEINEEILERCPGTLANSVNCRLPDLNVDLTVLINTMEDIVTK
ncbi:hypothetical protein KEM48_008420, partial [Puccinia striiformis f. sp. tritici PST-130]